jgi:hypothetical protein
MNQELADKISKAFEEKVNAESGDAQPEQEQSVEKPEAEQKPEEKEEVQEQPETPEASEEKKEDAPEEQPTQEAEPQGGEEQESEPSTPTFTFGEEEAKPEVNVEEYETLINQLKEENEKLKNQGGDVFASEELRAANDFVKSGGNIQDFFRAQSINVDVDFGNEQSMLDVLKTKYTTLDGFTEQEAERLIKKNYEALLDKEGADEEDIIDARIALKAAAKEATPKLKEFKDKATYSKPDPEVIKKRQEEFNRWKADTSHRLNNVKEFEFNLSDDFPIKVKMDNESHNYISSLLLNPENLQSYWVDRYEKDGKTDVDSFARDQFILLHAPKLIQTAYAQGESAGEKKFAQRELRQENPDGGKKRSTATSESESWKAGLLKTAQQVLR